MITIEILADNIMITKNDNGNAIIIFNIIFKL